MGSKSKYDPVKKKHVEFTSIQMTLQQVTQGLQQQAQLLQMIHMEYERLMSGYGVLQKLLNDLANNSLKFKEQILPTNGEQIMKEIDFQHYVTEFNTEMESQKAKFEEAQKKAEKAQKQINEPAANNIEEKPAEIEFVSANPNLVTEPAAIIPE